MKINVKRLLANTDNRSLIEALAGDKRYAVLSPQGQMLYGSDSLPDGAAHETLVQVKEIPVAVVRSNNSRTAEIIAKFISHIAMRNTKRKL